jgi:hypothetical protein
MPVRSVLWPTFVSVGRTVSTFWAKTTYTSDSGVVCPEASWLLCRVECQMSALASIGLLYISTTSCCAVRQLAARIESIQPSRQRRQGGSLGAALRKEGEGKVSIFTSNALRSPKPFCIHGAYCDWNSDPRCIHKTTYKYR